MSRAERILVASIQSFAHVTAIVVIGLSSLVLVGWTLESEIAKTGVPGLVSMKANTALCFFLAGIALQIKQKQADLQRLRMGPRIFFIGASVVTLAIGGITLAEYVLNQDAGIDELLFEDITRTVQTSHPGRMAPLSAINFVLLGLVLLLGRATNQMYRWIAQISVLFIVWISILALLGYARDAEALYRINLYTSMSLPTAVLFTLIGLAILTEQGNKERFAFRLFPDALCVRPAWRLIAILVLAGLYYGTARLGLLLQLPGTNATPVWPPSGIGFAAFLLFGFWIWPGIAVGAFLANLLTLPFTFAGMVSATLIALGNTLEAIIGVIVLRHFLPSTDPFERPQNVLYFVGSGAIACTVASLNGATSLYLTGIIPAELWKDSWFTWWLGDFAGVLIFTPVAYTWSRRPRLEAPFNRTMEFIGLAVLGTAVTEVVFGGWLPSQVMGSLPYLVLPALLWTAFRFGPRETASITVLMAAVATWHIWTIMNRLSSAPLEEYTIFVPFVSSGITPNDSLLMLQMFTATIAVTTLILSSAMDERKRVEVDLRESQEKYRTLFESIDQGFCTIEMLFDEKQNPIDYRFLMVNPAFERQTGIVNATGRYMREIAPLHEEHWFRIYGKIAMTGEALRFENSAAQLNRHYSVYAWRIGLPDERKVAILFNDITALKEAEQELKEADRRKDEFLATVSHELRTPLNAIHGWASLILEGKVAPENIMKALATIRRSAKDQNRLIEDLLDASRIMTGQLHLYVRAIEVDRIVKAAIDTIRPAAETKGLSLKAALDADLGPVTGDGERLQQAVWNLLSNAVKFTPKGGHIHIRVEQMDSQIEITVSDTGQGIQPSLLPYIFDRFRQGDSSISRRQGGLGLGLAIVREIVQLHGGSVLAESPGDGQGATFRIQLPRMAPVSTFIGAEITCHPTPQVNDGLPVDYPPVLKKLRVLIVDDDEASLWLLETLFKKCGCEVELARSGEVGLAEIQAWSPQLIVSDIGMPGMDGYVFMEKVRQHERANHRKTPAIAVTAYARTEDRIRAFSAGFQAYIVKPVDVTELLTVAASLASAFVEVRK